MTFSFHAHTRKINLALILKVNPERDELNLAKWRMSKITLGPGVGRGYYFLKFL